MNGDGRCGDGRAGLARGMPGLGLCGGLTGLGLRVALGSAQPSSTLTCLSSCFGRGPCTDVTQERTIQRPASPLLLADGLLLIGEKADGVLVLPPWSQSDQLSSAPTRPVDMLMEEREPTGAAGDPATMARGIGGNSLLSSSIYVRRRERVTTDGKVLQFRYTTLSSSKLGLDPMYHVDVVGMLRGVPGACRSS